MLLNLFHRAVAEGDTRARQHTAKIELALEATAREHFRRSHETLRKELYEQMDVKTQMLVSEAMSKLCYIMQALFPFTVLLKDCT